MKGIISLIALFSFLKLTAQLDISQFNTPYSGVHSLSYNPAEIVDSRYKFHLNLMSLGLSVSNDFVGVSNKMVSFSPPNLVDSNRRILLPMTLNGAPKNFYSQIEYKGPSFMYSLSNRHSIAISTGVKILVNGNNVNEKLARFMYDSKDSSSWGASSSKDFSAGGGSWGYIGLTYGRVLMDKNRNFLKAAVTVKANVGLANMNLTSPDLYVNFKDRNIIQDANGSYNIKYSQSFYDSTGKFVMPSFSFSNLGFGTDIGVIYERRDKDEYTYEMDCKMDNVINNVNKYRFRVGVSVTDFGTVAYKSKIPLSSFKLDSSKFNTDIDRKAFEKVVDARKFRDSLGKYENNGFTYDSTVKDYSFWTPSRLNLFIDYHIWKGFYVAANGSLGFVLNNDAASLTKNSYASFIPRFESKAIGLYLPVQYDLLSKEINVGAGARLLFLNLMIQDWTFIAGLKDQTKNFGFNMSINLPIRMKGKLKDKDGDLISDRIDKCKDGVGDCESGGCPPPDDDGDGVENKIDKCPSIKGPKELDGCPDADSDGITDKEDLCPKHKGSKELGGCPDTDGDGVIDKEDKCLKVKGKKEFEGCPDTDNDLIPDAKDDCPLDSGISENRGCPKLPPADTDGDGVIDSFDMCPNQAGAISNKGCPEVKETNSSLTQSNSSSTLSIEKVAQESLQFHTGSSEIKKTSYSSLNLFIDYMKKNPMYKLSLSGHTDNVGQAEKNMRLSIERANAVKTYIFRRGIDPSRIKADGFGDTRPIGDNNSEGGRAANRRVEFEISK